ncbi:MAG TPA: hypothetical protein VF322_09570 [Gammaproteobacteria bacterium]
MSIAGKLRACALLCTAASVGLPAKVIVAWRRYSEVHYFAQGITPEGKAVASGFMMLIPASVMLCLLGLGLGALAYRKLRKPRPAWRKVELGLQALPLLLWMLLAEPLFHWVRG